jgi:hypothetical protein
LHLGDGSATPAVILPEFDGNDPQTVEVHHINQSFESFFRTEEGSFDFKTKENILLTTATEEPFSCHTMEEAGRSLNIRSIRIVPSSADQIQHDGSALSSRNHQPNEHKKFLILTVG